MEAGIRALVESPDRRPASGFTRGLYPGQVAQDLEMGSRSFLGLGDSELSFPPLHVGSGGNPQVAELTALEVFHLCARLVDLCGFKNSPAGAVFVFSNLYLHPRYLIQLRINGASKTEASNIMIPVLLQ